MKSQTAFGKICARMAAAEEIRLDQAFDRFLSMAFDAELSWNGEPRCLTDSAGSEEGKRAFGEMFGMTLRSVRERRCDFLGGEFMASGIADASKGQVFTPDALAYSVAETTLADPSGFDGRKFIKLLDGCCGGGSMLLAAIRVMRDFRYDMSRPVFFGRDLDLRCVRMSYIQLSMAGAAALVEWGNSLTGERFAAFPTAAFKTISPLLLIEQELTAEGGPSGCFGRNLRAGNAALNRNASPDAAIK